MKTFPLVINSSAADVLPDSYARLSLPLLRGQWFDAPTVQIENSAGEISGAQSEILARWPDNSIRVLHSIFPARSGDYVAHLNQDASTPDAASPIEIRRDGEFVELETGKLKARIGGAHLIESLSCNGCEYFGEDAIEILVEDEQGKIFRATSCRDVSTHVETAGPLRAAICLNGQCCNGDNSFLDFRVRFEFWAGVEGFSVSYNFFNLERGADFHGVRAITFRLKLHEARAAEYSLCQKQHGIFGTPHVAASRESLKINVDDSQVRAYVENFDALGDQTKYPFYLQDGVRDVENWAAISDGSRQMILEMDDFHLLRPKNLILENGAASFGIWPHEAGTLELQQGRSREVTVRVALRDASTPLAQSEANARISQLRDVWRAQLPPEIYARAKFFDQERVLAFDPQAHPRFEGWLDRMSSGLHSVARFFDLGDTPDSGYRSTYLPLGRQKRMRGEDGGARWFSSGYHNPALPLNDLDDFEPVWVNNEYDVIFALGTEYLRTGDLTLFQRLKWFARHTVEVDFLHFSDHQWLHRAQPAHSARHTTTGAYPSHFWTQGLAQYYFLTADPDALEVIIALADKTIENFEDAELGAMNKGLNREAGWGVLSLVCAYEATLEKRFDLYARKLLDDIIAEGLPNDLPNFSFGHTSMLLAARQYLQVHGESDDGEYHEKLKTWFLSWVDLALECLHDAPQIASDKAVKSGSYDYTIRAAARGVLWSRSTRRGVFDLHSLALDCLAYAHEISGEEKYLRGGLRTLEELLQSSAFFYPAPEGKPFAMMYRTWINFLGACARQDRLTRWEYEN